ncbi:MAG: ABC transporter substrate-binding protein [Acidimicrobiia bacterium]|nr:ABC transporter substrate-binding protein [Acidimicrobiia bacterium]
MVLVAAACGNDDDSDVSPTTEAVSESESDAGDGSAVAPEPEDDGGAVAPEPEDDGDTPEPEGEDGTLRYFSMWNEGEPQQEVLQGIIDSFEEDTGVEVDVLWAGREVLTSVRAALSAGDPVDLIGFEAEPLAGALVNTGETRSLASVLEQQIPGEDVMVGDVIPSSFLDIYAVDGEPHIMPYVVNSSGIHYDGRRLTELGIERPKTWDEFIAASLAAGENAVQHDGLINFYNAYWLYWLIVRHGGPGAFNAAASDPTGEAWRSDAIAGAVEDLVELVESGALAEGYEGSNWPIAQQEWANGNGTFNINGTWLASETASYSSEGFEYRLLPFPTTEGGFESAEVYQIGWVVPQAADSPRAAQDFIAYALNSERLAGMVDVAKNLVPRSDIGVPPDLQDAVDMLAASPAGHRPYDGVQGDYPEYWIEFMLLDDQLFFGQISGEEFIDRIAAKTAEYWDSQ